MNVLSDALNTLNNAEKKGYRQCIIRPCSKVVFIIALMTFAKPRKKVLENAKIL